MIIQTGRRIMFYSLICWIFIEITLFAWKSYDSMPDLQGFFNLSIYPTLIFGIIFLIGLAAWIAGRLKAKEIEREIKKII